MQHKTNGSQTSIHRCRGPEGPALPLRLRWCSTAVVRCPARCPLRCGWPWNISHAWMRGRARCRPAIRHTQCASNAPRCTSHNALCRLVVGSAVDGRAADGSSIPGELRACSDYVCSCWHWRLHATIYPYCTHHTTTHAPPNTPPSLAFSASSPLCIISASLLHLRFGNNITNQAFCNTHHHET